MTDMFDKKDGGDCHQEILQHKQRNVSWCKIIKDCIYGHIHLSELCMLFMDVYEFQRLRRIRQLGVAHYAYPSAVHTRLEHSIGVMHLAGKMVDQLRNYVFISDRTKDLIQLAGMYHDIGHFAYSHLFDVFLEKINEKEKLDGVFRLTRHELRSVYFLNQVNNRLKLLTEDERQFVEDAIRGYVRDENFTYLYQIVCNAECGIDVDKMDYLRRDSYHTGFPGFHSDYIISNAVIDSSKHIAFKRKTLSSLEDLFMTRRRMYENVYQHHTNLKVDKIYFCAMTTLGSTVFKYGETTDDYNIETLIRNDERTRHLCAALDNRQLEHSCDFCHEYHMEKSVKTSGTIDRVRFVDH